MENNYSGGQHKLPNDPAALVLGIVGIVLSFCCAFIGLIPGVIGFIMANKGVKLFEEGDHDYSNSSYKQMKVAKILCIIAIVLGVIMTIYSIMTFDESMELYRQMMEDMEN